MPRLDSSTTNADSPPAIAGTFAAAARHDAMPALGPVFPLLLALASDEPATAAIRMTLELSREKGAMPTVVRALGDIRDAEVMMSSLAGTIVEEYLGPDYKNECRDAVAKQVKAVAGDVDWPLDITDQSPIEAIVERARQLRPGLIVMGLRRHGVLQRAISRDLLGEVVRVTRVPVLAIRPGFSTLPKRIVVAIDFREASIHAARLARRLISDEGAIYLVHVSQKNSAMLRARLEALIDELSPAPGITMTSILLHGDVHSSIEGLGQAVDADLLAVGSDDHSLLDRLTTGSISMRLAHTARWSTLVVPSQRAS
jgi:nucleotide-binding universal stress UspA family protein